MMSTADAMRGRNHGAGEKGLKARAAAQTHARIVDMRRSGNGLAPDLGRETLLELDGLGYPSTDRELDQLLDALARGRAVLYLIDFEDVCGTGV